MRVDEGFGLVIPTWPPEAEARLLSIGAKGGGWLSALESICRISAETRARQACTVSTFNGSIVRLSLAVVQGVGIKRILVFDRRKTSDV